MFSSRRFPPKVPPKVLVAAGLFRAIFGARRRANLMMLLLLASSLLIAAGVVAARKMGSEHQAGVQSPALAVPPALYSHIVRPVGAAAFDISATPVTTVSAASFEGVSVAPESIVSAFGTGLATTTLIALTTPLPTDLGGTSVEVNGRKAGLFFVSPNQINYAIPAATESGTAAVVVKAGTTTSNGSVQVTRVAPAVFTANSNGHGVPAATIFRFSTVTGSQRYEELKQLNPATGRFVTKPIDLGPASDQVFLVLYVSGLRQAADDNGDGDLNDNVRVLIGGIETTPDDVVPLPQFVGLEQINVQIPRSLIGRGIVSVSVVGLGYGTSNVVDVEIAGATGNTPPQLTGFSGTALAGAPFVINGMGFSPIKEENEVRIAGRNAIVTSATTTQLNVMAPFGVETGTVSVRNLATQGEGRSTEDLVVRTSVSGFVENTSRQPLGGVAIRLCNATEDCNSPLRTATTSADGAFVLPDVGEGVLSIEVDGGVVQTDPPYPKVALIIITQRNRDNQFPRNISLQQSIGGSGMVGGSSLTNRSGAGQDTQIGQSGAALPPPAPQTVTIQTGDFQLQVPSGTKVQTPSGGTSATLVLTQVQNGRTPVPLPYGYYSTSIVQITPFNVKLDPGAKLVFPNTDGFPAGAPLVLFRFDQASGKFAQERASVAVSEDGQRIETEANAIKITSYYFASIIRNTTTITGRVVDSDGKPRQNALVRFRGQESLTDGNGSYLLRYVPVEEREMIAVEVSSALTSSRVDRVLSQSVPAVVGGLTKVPDVVLPNSRENRPPQILVAPKIELDEGKVLRIPIVVTDPDVGQTVRSVTVSGAPFVKVTQLPFGVTAYTLELTPDSTQSGEYTVVISATDSAGAVGMQNITVIVRDIGRKPTAIPQALIINEDATTSIKLEGSDPDGSKLSFKITSQPTFGSLSGEAPNLTYKPNLNFNGADRFSFIVTNGSMESDPATVNLVILPVNDPPILTVPAAITVNAGQLISFAVIASDPDAGDKLTISAANQLPTGASLTPATATSSQFRWMPASNQAGNYVLSFKVTDSATPALSDSKDVRITVNDVSLLSVPGAQVVSEGKPLTFDVVALPSATGAAVTIEAIDRPQGAVLSIPVSNSAQFSWTPSFTQAGVYNVSFKATVAGTVPITETRQVRITVLDVVRDLAKEATLVSIWGAAARLPLSVSDDGDLFGSSVATGDLNGDGIPDLAVGAPGANGVGFDNGKVYVFFGRANWAGSIDLAQQKADLEILGEAAEDHFGASLAIGDLNGDNKDDLVIGAPMADGSGITDAGKVYVIFGGPGRLPSSSDSISRLASVSIIGAQRSEWFGTSVGVGMIHNKNGAADLIVGAPGYDAPSTTAALTDVGAAYLFFGSPQLARNIELSKSPANYKVTGTFTGGLAGTKVAVGNFNGDDYTDFAISAPAASASGLKSNGLVFLALGGANLSGEKNTSQASSLILFGGREGDQLGASLLMGDINGDGRADLIIAATGGDGPENSRPGAGNVYVLYGSATVQGRPADLVIFGSSANGDEIPDALGTTLAVGDFNGDGIADLAIGAPGADNADQKRDPVGAVYIIYGARTGLTGVYDLATKAADWTAWGADAGDNLGGGGIAIANINASEPADVILGIPKSASLNNSRPNAGEVRIVYGIKP